MKHFSMVDHAGKTINVWWGSRMLDGSVRVQHLDPRDVTITLHRDDAGPARCHVCHHVSAFCECKS